MNDRVKYLLKLVLPVFLLCLFLLPLATWVSLASFAFFYWWVYIIGCNRGLHLYWAHRQFDLSPAKEKFVTFGSLFAMVGDPISFSRTHRWHHRFSDTEKDVHRPTLGFYESFIGWQFTDFQVPLTMVKDLLRIPYLIAIAKRQLTIIWATLLILIMLSPSIAYGLIMAMCASWLLEMLTNFVAHDKNGPRNVKWLCWLSLGPPHKDHHDKPGTWL